MSVILEEYTKSAIREAFNIKVFNLADKTVRGFNTFKVDKPTGILHIPIGKWREYYSVFPRQLEEYPRILSKPFVGKLFTAESDPTGRERDQITVVNSAFEKFRDTHSAFIAAFTGFGKTSMGCFIALKLRLKTCVVCYSTGVLDQWADSFKTFSNGKIVVQYLKGNFKINPKADVYLVGAEKAGKISPDVLESIGFVIIDEAHLSTKELFTNSILNFTPLFLLGLSATPDRQSDGLHALLTPFFGDFKDFIFRKEIKEFRIIRVKTLFKPTEEFHMFKGKVTVNYTILKQSLEDNPFRQKFIADLARKFSKENILILAGSKNCTRAVYNLLTESGESVSLYSENAKKFDSSPRIKIISHKKGGTGIDDKSANMSFMTTSVKDCRQFEGRLRTVGCTIIDLVDDHRILSSHFSLRKKWYLSKGAEIYTANRVNSKELLSEIIPDKAKVRKIKNPTEPAKRYLPALK